MVRAGDSQHIFNYYYSLTPHMVDQKNEFDYDKIINSCSTIILFEVTPYDVSFYYFR